MAAELQHMVTDPLFVFDNLVRLLTTYKKVRLWTLYPSKPLTRSFLA